MKAVICTKYGKPEVLKVQEIEKPTANKNEILVKIHSTSVNSADVRVRSLDAKGIMKTFMKLALGFSKPRNPILGTVFSGIIEEVGEKVTRFKLGDKVFGMTGFKFGTYSEYIALNEKSLTYAMPENANFNEAVSLIFGGQTAIYFLEKAKIRNLKKPKVLIIGATGSVGVAATQLCLHYGHDVTVVCSSKGLELVQKLGVKNIILYDKQDFTKMDLKFDFIFDAHGKSNKKQCKNLLKNNGVFKTVGGLEMASESLQQLESLKNLFETGAIKSIIDRTYLMKDVVEAHQYVDSGRKKGNVILKIHK
ncbi:NAD(P)-dependent alcohol dehydrogenase [Brumimicrobium mesophilum]|uniref:NAD(P)-dependent alcohol dehydrogenase n=1 Tax=Brumimicrobium mesophilum TaxID=392717 RepID=UPI000D13F355|nr:NAD(P)-dependent alcohol dehydrogenase [Brumimicrobium mesophilum]